MRSVPPELIEFVRSGSAFIVAGHKEPDGDCVGSQLALASLLTRLGKRVALCSAGPFKRPEIRPFEARFSQAPTEEQKAGARAIVVDCSNAERTGDLAAHLAGLPTAIIDHHASNEGGAAVSFVDPKAPSVTVLVQALIAACGLEPTKEEAEYLLFGLSTDTGFFRHLDVGSEATFEDAAAMVRAGASPKRTFAAINGGKNFESRILMGIVLSRATAHFGGKLILSYENLEDTERYGLQGRDSDAIYQLLQAVSGVEAIVLIRQETPDNCTVGFRSRDAVDVAAVAAKFGGGGHKQAAGLSAPGTIAELRERILAEFEPLFCNKP